MPAVELTPDPNDPSKGNLTVDGTHVTSINITHAGGVNIELPTFDPGYSTESVFVTRRRSQVESNTESGISVADGNVVARYPGKPDIVIPICEGVPSSPSPGATPLVGQDEYLYDLAYAIKNRMNTMVTGPTGCGKTVSFQYLAALLNCNLVTVSITPGTDEDSIIGSYMPAAHPETGAPTVQYLDQAITKAVRLSNEMLTFVQIEEMNRVSNVNIFASLMTLLDGSGFIQLPTGERVHRGDLLVVATCNPADEYVGTNELDPALESRFPWAPSITYPKPEHEFAAISSRVPELGDEYLRQMSEVVKRIRSAGEISHPIGFRPIEAWAQALASGSFSWHESATRSFINKFPRDERKSVENIITMFTPNCEREDGSN